MLSFLRGWRLTKADKVQLAGFTALTLSMFALHLTGLTGTNMSWMVAVFFLAFAAGYGYGLNESILENSANRTTTQTFIAGLATGIILMALFLLCLKTSVETYSGIFAVLLWHLYAWQVTRFATGSCTLKEFNAKSKILYRP